MRRLGLKHSRQRDVVVDVFLGCAGHVTVDELGARVRERDPSVGQTTVYRAVKLLADCGLATAHRFGAGETRYEPARPGTHHDHLVCTRCGAIEEFEDDAIEQLQAAAARRHGFVLEGHVFELYGRCRACRERQGRNT
jgi:Fur family ferric uptake transcriptional regulator